ncbi:hypothetical protein HYW83_02350 [Candidatus Peregrinibacteria bacterium]|nr:hypothetical protein [Candidatus Peregrinibacteria bacterium]
MPERNPLPFDTAQGVGMPSRVIHEPFALEQLHTMVSAALRSRDLARSRGEEPKGHRVVVADLMQIANLVVSGQDRNDTLLPQEAWKVLDLEHYPYLVERWTEIEPVARRVISTHEAAVEAMKLDNVVPVTVSSMQVDPERIFHSSEFRLLLSALWGSKDTIVHAAGDPETSVAELLESLMPRKHRRRFEKAKGNVRSGYYTYGLFEVAFLAELAKLGATAIQYGNRRERGYAELTKAVLGQVLRLNSEVTDRVTIMPETGMLVAGGLETDSYRVGRQEFDDGKRLTINPPPSLDDLRALLLNGTTQRFSSEKWQYIKIHIMRLLDRLAEILDIEIGARNRISGIYQSADSADRVTEADAAFVIELLHGVVIEPLRVILEKKGLIWVPPTPGSENGPENGGTRDPDSDPSGGAGGGDTSGAAK